MSALVIQLLQGRHQDLGGFSVRRLFPCRELARVGPWVFFDHAGPADFEAGEGINVRPHPHINMATVTYLFEGEILHRDSLGNEQLITPGAINLMVAGRGIVHSERERDEVKNEQHRVHGLQLWLALPAAEEEIEPAFHHYTAAEIPTVDVDGVATRVLIGHAYGTSSPVRSFADTLYAEAKLDAGQQLLLPDSGQRALYVAGGEVRIDKEVIAEGCMAVLAADAVVRVSANEDSRIVVIGGEDIGERHVWWNFVSSRRERIEQAKQDWRDGNFPKVPGDEIEFIPLPDE